MVSVIQRPRFSIGKFQDVYRIELPGDRSVSLDQVIQFYRGRGIQESRVGSDEVHFARGKSRRGILNFSDLSLKHEIRIKLQAGNLGDQLICQYQCFCVPLGTVRFPPWDLEEEVQQLEACLLGAMSGGGQVGAAALGVAGSGERARAKSGIGSPMTPILRLLYLVYRLLSGLRYWAGRRLTRPGLAVGVALLFAGLLSLDVENTVAYQGFALLLALVFIAMCFGLRFRGRFSAERILPRFGTVGVPIQYQVSVRNLTGTMQAGLALLENLLDTRPTFVEWHEVMVRQEKVSDTFRFTRARQRNPFKRARLKEAVVPNLLPGEQADVPMQITPLRRGVLRFSGLTVGRADPLGLFRSFARMSAPETTLILPRRYPLPAIALPGTLKYQEGGVALASNVGQSEEFVALRDYRQGDPLRKIHWRSWARMGRPIVKECEDEFFVRHALILDTFTRHAHSEVFEEAVSVAASFACTVLSQESLLDLLFVGAEAYCFTAGRGVAHADQMLEILASIGACTEQPFQQLETAVLNHVSVVSGCICVFLEWDSVRQEMVRKLRTLGVPVLVLVIVRPGAGNQLDPGPMRDDPDRFQVVEAGRVEEGLAKLS